MFCHDNDDNVHCSFTFFFTAIYFNANFQRSYHVILHYFSLLQVIHLNVKKHATILPWNIPSLARLRQYRPWLYHQLQFTLRIRSRHRTRHRHLVKVIAQEMLATKVMLVLCRYTEMQTYNHITDIQNCRYRLTYNECRHRYLLTYRQTFKNADIQTSGHTKDMQTYTDIQTSINTVAYLYRPTATDMLQTCRYIQIQRRVYRFYTGIYCIN